VILGAIAAALVVLYAIVVGMKKAATYHPAVIPLVEGAAHGISISLRNYPVREADNESGRRVEAFPDFNVALVNAVWGQISDYNAFIVRACVSPVTLYLSVRDCAAIPMEICVAKQKTEREFVSEMPDALIDAFRRAGIGR
jgi:hypothetical protein